MSAARGAGEGLLYEYLMGSEDISTFALRNLKCSSEQSREVETGKQVHYGGAMIGV